MDSLHRGGERGGRQARAAEEASPSAPHRERSLPFKRPEARRIWADCVTVDAPTRRKWAFLVVM